ncbi:MAG: hypothetical protein P4L87_20225 [Formivibrio sp.]|nr:hypothetical protein [Formivibrio sp.]
MNNRISVLLGAIILVAATGTALASNSGRSGSTAGGSAGGASLQHISPEGVENSNGRNDADRKKGLARADERRSEQGLTHAKTGKHLAKRKHKKPKDRK